MYHFFNILNSTLRLSCLPISTLPGLGVSPQSLPVCHLLLVLSLRPKSDVVLSVVNSMSSTSHKSISFHN